MRRAAALGLALLACGREPPPAVVQQDPAVESEAPSNTTPDLGAEPGTNAAPPSVPAPPQLPATTLPLVLLATQVPEDPAQARATIRDAEAGTIAHYRSGDAIRKTAIVASIAAGRVELLHDEQREVLLAGAEPAALSPDDVFYADFIDESMPETMADGVQLESGPGWVVKTPAYAWGTRRAVHRLREALRAYVRVAEGGPDVHVGDLSKPGGGPFPPHISHRAGRDVDIGYVLRGSVADVSRFVTATAANLDRARTWKLVRALLDSHAVAWIFMDYEVQRLLYEHALGSGTPRETLDALFQYPKGNRATAGIIRDWRGHADHFHVRWTQ
ncbi:MAG: penicillin-insensitive murein endopeptidase [Nannocystaceae bacterium]|nr:penicillin-insensitive murein endopeptidase [Nannocystaceae bacterium]